MIDSIINSITERFYAWFGWVTDPFFGWLWLALGIALVVILVTWFFGAWFPVLKPIGGVILLLLTFGLVAYRRGENDQKAIAKKRAPPPRKPPPPRPPWPPLWK